MEKCKNTALLTVAILLFANSAMAASLFVSNANSKSAGGSSWRLLGRGFLYDLESTQDGRTVEAGNATITRLDVQYRLDRYNIAAGIMSGYDTYGEHQTDTSLGITLEYSLDHMFLDLGYGIMRQEFDQRAIKSRNGSLFTIFFGFRDSVFFDWLYYDVGFQWRYITLNYEDGRKLPAPVFTKETLPLVGFGIML